MKFSDMQYKRPDLDNAVILLSTLAKQAQAATDGETLINIFNDYQTLINQVNTARTLCSIRHTVDTRDEFYDKENDYYDQQMPVVMDKVLVVYRALLASPHCGALEQKYGRILLDKLEIAVKSSDERLVPLQQQENVLQSQYQKLYASAKIPFRGEVLTVSQLTPYKQSTDRAIRKEAFQAEGGFFDSHQAELDDIYDKLVKNRTEQAKLLGYDRFTPLGDIRMERNGYGRKEIAACREAVVNGIVPVVKKLKDLQRQRIGVDALKFYDEPLSFKDGNPTPQGTPEQILAAGQKMYQGLSKETAAFIDFMMEGDLFDVLSKPGKAPGGYCTYIPQYQSPFIFSNFNGTAGDVDVLTHEAGHAFAAYVAAHKGVPAELQMPGLESCEIHSMSMEFLTAKYHHLFFGDAIGKYEVSHTEDALFFLPYGCQVDEFQEIVYAKPEMTPAQRNEVWKELDKKYRPWIEYEQLPFYGRGAGWQRQLHIYEIPFYYIDYVLAQAVALNFFLANNSDHEDAWKRYMDLVNQAGTKTYPDLVAAAGFKTPFDAQTMARVGEEVCAWVEAHPLSK